MSSSKTTVYVAADHAGFEHKNQVRNWLISEGYTVFDCGASTLDPQDDYPDYIGKAARAVSKSPQHRALIFGGSGQGEAIVANRFKNVRATVFYGGPDEIISLSRAHNDANVLSIGARFITIEEAKRVIWSWLHKEFTRDDRHKRRIRKIELIELPEVDG